MFVLEILRRGIAALTFCHSASTAHLRLKIVVITSRGLVHSLPSVRTPVEEDQYFSKAGILSCVKVFVARSDWHLYQRRNNERYEPSHMSKSSTHFALTVLHRDGCQLHEARQPRDTRMRLSFPKPDERWWDPLCQLRDQS